MTSKIKKLIHCNKLNIYNCKKNKQYEFNNIDTIYVIGDIHGDFNILLKTLKKANIIKGIDNKNRYIWMAENAHIVQLGDILDKGGRGILGDAIALEEYTIFDYLNRLNIKANKKGGAVHYLVGNHEIMNIMGDFNYAHPKHIDDTGIELRRQLFQPGGYMAKMLACHSYGILKINDWYFCHAGLLPHHVKSKTIIEINDLLRDLMTNKKNIQQLSDEERKMIFGSDGFLWNRQYRFNDQSSCSLLSETMNNLNNPKGKMIVGHTPQKKINSMCNSKLWFADVGLSQAFGDSYNSYQILKITNKEDVSLIS